MSLFATCTTRCCIHANFARGKKKESLFYSERDKTILSNIRTLETIAAREGYFNVWVCRGVGGKGGGGGFARLYSLKLSLGASADLSRVLVPRGSSLLPLNVPPFSG